MRGTEMKDRAGRNNPRNNEPSHGRNDSRSGAGNGGFEIVRGEGIPGRETPVRARPRARTIAVVSGKGGVGKTTLVTNLAIALHREGCKVLVVDGDLGMANVDVFFGLIPKYTLHNVVLGERTAEEILIHTSDGVHLMPGSSGVEEMANLDDLRCERLLRSVTDVEEGMDLILIDTAPGLHRTTTHLARAADEVVIVTTPEPTSWADAYATLRTLRKRGPHQEPWLVVNQARDAYEAKATMSRIRETALRFLEIEPRFLGFVLEDPAVATSVRRQEPLLRLYPTCPAASCVQLLAQRLIAPPDPEEENAPHDHRGRSFADWDSHLCGHRARA
jgi:flagellar biosynthesis protein FlhG